MDDISKSYSKFCIPLHTASINMLINLKLSKEKFTFEKIFLKACIVIRLNLGFLTEVCKLRCATKMHKTYDAVKSSSKEIREF